MSSHIAILRLLVLLIVRFCNGGASDGPLSLHAKYDAFLQLVHAVSAKDKPLVRELLRQGANPNIGIEYGTVVDFVAQ